MKLLHIDTSILGAQSASRSLTAAIVATWRARYPALQVDYLDLAIDAPNHLAAESLNFAAASDDPSLSPAQKRENAVSETLISQFLAADVLVIGAPKYNFSIPSQLKAWIDRITQAGRTFKYTEQGPIGLAGGKTVVIASTRGGIYSTTAAGQALEHQESYLQVMLNFIGITDVHIVRAEGLNMGEAVKAQALQDADSAILALENALPVRSAATV